MNSNRSSPEEKPKVLIFFEKSVLFNENGITETFEEGPPSEQALERQKKLDQELKTGFLANQITKARNSTEPSSLSADWKTVFDDLVEGITAGSGRALGGLAVQQLCIKIITPEQSVRLHKSGKKGPNDFSWVEGVSMRTLDNKYITPTLRKEGLLSLNKDGVMMTRSLAENYPYSSMYKAKIKGPVSEWRKIVEGLESGDLCPKSGLTYLLFALTRKSKKSQDLFDSISEETKKRLVSIKTINDALNFIDEHMETSQNPARLLEVAIHSLMQTLFEQNLLKGRLKPLAQMRSANKKANNIGDVETVSLENSESIIEAWDAKYEQSNLYDSITELQEKIESRTDINEVGFILSHEPDLSEEEKNLLTEIGKTKKVSICSLEKWAEYKIGGSPNTESTVQKWIEAYVDSLCLKNYEIAPIDEPTDGWVKSLEPLVKNL